MGASSGMVGTARMQYHLRQTMVFLNMHPLNRPEIMVGLAQEKFGPDGKLKDEKTKELIKTFLIALADWTEKIQSIVKIKKLPQISGRFLFDAPEF